MGASSNVRRFFVRYCYSYFFFLNCRWSPGGEVRLHYLEFGMCGRCGRGISGALYNMGEWDNGNRCKGISIHEIYLFFVRVMGCDGGHWRLVRRVGYDDVGVRVVVAGIYSCGGLLLGYSFGCFVTVAKVNLNLTSPVTALLHQHFPTTLLYYHIQQHHSQSSSPINNPIQNNAFHNQQSKTNLLIIQLPLIHYIYPL